jgi:signal transduction histidine kinase
VKADLQQLRQALSNLFVNACQASREGGLISIGISVENTSALIRITDEGSGIKRENMNRIFEPFFSTKIYGIGLGLSTAKRVIVEHGGAIVVESEGEGKGTTFTVTLPV